MLQPSGLMDFLLHKMKAGVVRILVIDMALFPFAPDDIVKVSCR